MHLTLSHSQLETPSLNVTITGSKSESNRLLLLQALYPELKIENISNSDDSQLMQKALQFNADIVDIHHAGTAMRFLTAYLAIQEGKTTLITGSKRMKERPIKILVDALKTLGADISYVENEGYPPLLIKGKILTSSQVSLKANVSSQYISALLLIASKLNNGLELHLEGEITSIPYINMTLNLLNSIGIQTQFKNNTITVHPKTDVINKTELIVESDWSSASYFYSCVALSPVGTKIHLKAYKKNSLQGDSVLAELYQVFGVETQFEKHAITIKKINSNYKAIHFNLIKAPDIAQTIAVTAFGLGLACNLTGLHTLKIKETDRLVALKTELEKLGAEVKITNKSLSLSPNTYITPNINIKTYNDHRMAMAFAPLALKAPVGIIDAEVVSKSYPDFWDDLKNIGFLIAEK